VLQEFKREDSSGRQSKLCDLPSCISTLVKTLRAI
jgi:hypothetical protein